MEEIKLRYGTNPHQKDARAFVSAGTMPLKVLNGQPSYINILDALYGWQLVRELKAATGLPAAASFKHTSPAGVAIARPLTETFRRSQFLKDAVLSPVATAYARARGGDRMCSYGDAAAVSDPVDVSLANLLAPEVSDLVVAPGYEPAALEILKKKQGGRYLVLQIDPNYEPPCTEQRQLFGIQLEQMRNDGRIDRALLRNVVTKTKTIPEDVAQTLIVATIALKYTQSNSVCVAYDGQVIGMGAGQQSRVHCTRLACDKADKWFLQQHPRVLDLPFKDGLKRPEKANVVDQYLLWDQLAEAERTAMLAGLSRQPDPLGKDERIAWVSNFDGICLSSDGFIPFRDNIDRASRSHVQYVIQPGGSVRDEGVIQAANEYGMVMVESGLRLFLH
jgi:phosphoribosylaminoimidazolecarboxamide formyltransferase / IMP cyclohydrolase